MIITVIVTVSQFLSRNKTLQSMSRTDRQVIALAHTLELEHEGSKNLRDNKVSKAMSVVGGKSGNPQVKKSKTGRIHTQASPMKDTGIRIAKLKKVIAFHFDDFMTLSQQQCTSQHSETLTISLSLFFSHHILSVHSLCAYHQCISLHSLNGINRSTAYRLTHYVYTH